MPYKVVGNCVHKYNPATEKVGAVVKCHESHEKAAAHLKALYANVKDVAKEVIMSSSRKNRANHRKMRSSKVTPEELLKAEEEAEEEALEELELEEDEPLTEDELALLEEEGDKEVSKEISEPEEIEKDYYGTAGAKSWEELDKVIEIQEKTEQLRKTAYAAEDMVFNILYAPEMSPDEKASAIKKVADGFGQRATASTKMEKEIDLDLLELEAILAKDHRDISIGEQVADWLTKKKLSYGARKKLSDSDFALPGKRKYPIHDKAHVRNALSRAAQQIKGGGQGAADARAALPKIRAAAKKFSIGQMKKEMGGILVEKDAQGDWRWVGFPTNNFKDRSQDIITEAAHKEYVEWVNKDLPNRAPVFTSCHTPGTVRENPVDFVGYENGFVVMSGKLTDAEAAGLMKAAALGDIGMSHTGWGLRNSEDPHLIEKYRSFEVTDLPLKTADNPFTNDFDVYSKEANMATQLEHLTALLGSKEKAEEALKLKTSLKQKELQEAKVESKETPEQPETQTTVVNNTVVNPATDELVKQIAEALEIEALSEFVQKATVAMEKVEALETAVAALSKEQDEKLAEKIAPKVGSYAWSKRASQDDETLLKEEENKDDKELGKSVPEVNWLNAVTNTQPLTQ